MTREEAIQILSTRDWSGMLCGYTGGYTEALDMAIEALQEPKTIIGIDIPYGSDRGIATLFKRKDDKLILEDMKEIMSVVQCEDCRYANECHKNVQYTHNEQNMVTIGYTPIEWCSKGERREL